MQSKYHGTDPFRIRNIKLFIAFRVFFNARFYYPVFTILFLDLGLTLEQFAMLNVVWALSIVIFEIPSGALADTFGRKRLLVLAALCMVLEMALFSFAPANHPNVLFLCLIFNRLLSGLAEAAASGTDEALAYASLLAVDQAHAWGRVLEAQMRYQAMAFVAAMTIGALVYDPDFVRRVTTAVGLNVPVNQSVTLRFPLYLTFSMSLVVLIVTLFMNEPRREQASADNDLPESRSKIREAIRITLDAGRWIWKTPFALLVILAALFFDHIVRMMVTLTSQYYRIIHIPEATFGFIGSGLALIGVFVPRLALWMSRTQTPRFNMSVLAIVIFAGLMGLIPCWPYWGVIPVVLLHAAISINNFLASHYLNHIADSTQRATVLSFRGLSFNLAYGAIGILYALLVHQLRGHSMHLSAAASSTLQSQVFKSSLAWFPIYFLVGLILLWWISSLKLKGAAIHKKVLKNE